MPMSLEAYEGPQYQSKPKRNIKCLYVEITLKKFQ